MYPKTKIDLSANLPSAAEFWVPGEEELESDEGFGYFRSVWLITDITKSEAHEVLTKDRSLFQIADSLAGSNLEYDKVATALETGSVEGIEGLTEMQLARINPYLTDVSALEGLEIGVAGLVYCLAAAGMYPAASCRGHEGSRAWSPNPVVFLATDREHAEVLQPLVGATACGFNIDPGRPELLAIEGQSVSDTLRLAVAVFDHMVESDKSDQGRPGST